MKILFACELFSVHLYIMITHGQDDVSQLGLDGGVPHHRCTQCGAPSDEISHAFGADLCPDCVNRFVDSEQEEGGPFKVVLWQFTSAITGSTIEHSYFFDDIWEAMQFGMTWRSKMYNRLGYVVMDYTKLPF